jgi:hypothetical protein
VEAYFPGNGWLTFDPTPGGSSEAGGVFSRMALYLDWFQLAWNEWVINYDLSHQTELARNVGQVTLDWKRSWERKFRHMQNVGMRWLTDWQRSHELMRLVFPIVLLLALVLLQLGWLRGFFRWVDLQWETKRPAVERNNPQLAARMYTELLRVLEKQGFLRRETQTPREFAASLTLRPALAPTVREFTDLYLQARFGGLPCDALRLRALLDKVRTMPRAR